MESDVTDEQVGLGSQERWLAPRRPGLSHLVRADEVERRRIAARIHDDPIQTMAACVLQLQILGRRLDHADDLRILDTISESVRDSIDGLRNLITELHPPAFDVEGLPAALQSRVERFQEETSTRCSLSASLSGWPQQDVGLTLYRVVEEALSNVRKHARARSVTVTVDERARGFAVQVTDDGVGFSADPLAADSGFCGLAAVAERAALAGGRLTVTSAPGEGTRVECWIPGVASELAEPRSVRREQRRGSGPGGAVRVLIADDDRAMRDGLAALIAETPGLELVATADNAHDATTLAERERPDVALIDVRMPGGGAFAAANIRQSSPVTHVLALSGHDDRSSVLEMLEAGAVGFLVKGGPIDALVSSIEDAAAGRANLASEVTGGVIAEAVEQHTQRARERRRRRTRRARIAGVLDDPATLSTVYQPVCTLDGRETVGAEALSRFHAVPSRGPAQWFAEAGAVRLGVKLELAAIAKALADLDKLPPAAFLSVNASPMSVASCALLDLLDAVDARRVVVELTEHAPISDYARLNRSLDKLRTRGARLAVDDAGAGFASLRHILRLNPDFIKLDRALIAGIATDVSRQALAAGLISFAEKSGATVIAEGIERAAEIKMLVRLGVRYGQGYIFARPSPLPLGDPSARYRPRKRAQLVSAT